MQLTTDLLTHVLLNAGKPAAPWLSKAAERFNINTEVRLAYWLGQMDIESGGFTRLRESLNYATDSDMMRKFIGWGRITAADAARFGRAAGQRANQNALANILYGGAFGVSDLGNTEPGDGAKYIGRGYKQITGRTNYGHISQVLFGDDRLLDTPEILEQPEWAALSAGAYWEWRNVNKHADKHDIVAVTRAVNGGTVGIDDRREMTSTYLNRIQRYQPPKAPNFDAVESGYRVGTTRFRDGG